VSRHADELVRLTIAANETEAELIRGLLGTEGIESMHRQMDFAAGAFDGWAPGGAREILVRAADLDRAQELVADSDWVSLQSDQDEEPGAESN
jgi:Putative prokaryotic signal transducing protein